MNISKDEKKVLRSLSENTVLMNYLDRMEDWICDIRNGEHTIETRGLVHKIIRECLIDKIKLNNVVNRSDDDFE